MAKDGFFGSMGHSVLTYLPHLLVIPGFILMAVGVATMQGECGASGANGLYTGGSIGYLSPVTCAKLLSFDWFIVFWEALIWLLLLGFIVSRTVHKWRAGLNALLITATILTIFFTNVWYRPWSGFAGAFGDSFTRRAKVAFAGGLITSLANILLMMSM